MCSICRTYSFWANSCMNDHLSPSGHIWFVAHEYFHGISLAISRFPVPFLIPIYLSNMNWNNRVKWELSNDFQNLIYYQLIYCIFYFVLFLLEPCRHQQAWLLPPAPLLHSVHLSLCWDVKLFHSNAVGCVSTFPQPCPAQPWAPGVSLDWYPGLVWPSCFGIFSCSSKAVSEAQITFCSEFS